MRFLLLAATTLFFIGCESSGSKDPNQAMDDTARMRNPPEKEIPAIEPVKLAATDVPPEIKFNGKFQEAWTWKDELGENVLVLSFTEPYDDKEKNEFGEEGETAAISAVHYAKKDGGFAEIWLLNEKEKSCPFDITCNFIKNSTTVTDLDKNGIAEIKLQYLLSCRSDVSPATMKLALYENGVKYGLKGNSWIKYSPDQKFTVKEGDVNMESQPKAQDETEEMLRSFGRYENERDFASAPAAFLPYARKEWLKYVIEKMGE